MHQVYDQIAAAVSIPFRHIADPTAAAIRTTGLTRVGLLGTRSTMERGFYQERLKACWCPTSPTGTRYTGSSKTSWSKASSAANRKRYLEVISRLTDQGAEAIIAGCTEIELLVPGDEASLPAASEEQPPLLKGAQKTPSRADQAIHNRNPRRRRSAAARVHRCSAFADHR